MENKLIFFVDDDRTILNVLEYTLSSWKNCEVRSFSNGEDLINNLQANPDIVVLDHYLSIEADGLTGLDVLREIKKANPEIDVIILSQVQDSSIREQFIQEGAIKFIDKNDFFLDVLLDTLQHLVK